MANYTADGRAFIASVEHYCEGLRIAPGPSPGCAECLPCDDPDVPGDDWHDLASEPSFSRSQCDSCGTRYGGDRYPAHGIDRETGDVYHFDVCADCYTYHANGDVPETWAKVPAHW